MNSRSFALYIVIMLAALVAVATWASKADRETPCSAYSDSLLRNVPARCLPGWQR